MDMCRIRTETPLVLSSLSNVENVEEKNIKVGPRFTRFPLKI